MLSSGYILYSLFLFLELSIIKGGIFTNGSFFWKSILQKLYLYPPSVSFDQLNAWSSVGGLSGFTALHHSLAVYLGTIFIFSIFIFPRYNVRFSKYISFTSFIFLFFTNSRTAIISIILSFLIYSVLYKKYSLKNLFNLGIIICSIFILFAFNYNLIENILSVFYAFNYFLNNFSLISLDTVSSFQQDGSTLTRLLYDVNSVSLIQDNIFLGVGVLDNNLASDYKPHSTLLINLQMFGIFPVLFLVYFIFRVFTFGNRCCINKKFIFVMLAFLLLTSFGTNIITDLRSLFPVLIFFAFVLKCNQSKQFVF
jgi:hypothetical protein